jgi:hypothetical protein
VKSVSDIIDLSEFKNKVRDKDVDELENYIYSLYFEVAEGKMTLADVNRKISKYVEENGISNSKFMEIQKKLIARYGYNADDLEAQLMQGSGILLQNKGLLEKYGKSIEEMTGYRKEIHNERNDVVLFCSGKKVIILSEKTVDLEDTELEEFLVSYKRQAGDEKLDIELGEGMKTFQY